MIRTLLVLLFYYARKIIILSSKKPVPPSVMAWKTLINRVLPLYRATYTNRGAPGKFDKVWGGWINDKSTTSDWVPLYSVDCSRGGYVLALCKHVVILYISFLCPWWGIVYWSLQMPMLLFLWVVMFLYLNRQCIAYWCWGIVVLIVFLVLYLCTKNNKKKKIKKIK